MSGLPAGEWEVPDDVNGVPSEPTDVQKRDGYTRAWNCITGHTGVSFGGTLFHYGTEYDFGAVWFNLTPAGKKRLSFYAVQRAFGGATPVVPKFISGSDPASRWTGANGGLAFFAYCTNYLIDLKHAVIMDVEATTAVRQAEVTAQRVMLDRTQERFGIWPERLAADTGYGDAANLAWLVHERTIEPHIPVFDKSNRTDGTLSRSDFFFDAEQDQESVPDLPLDFVIDCH